MHAFFRFMYEFPYSSKFFTASIDFFLWILISFRLEVYELHCTLGFIDMDFILIPFFMFCELPANVLSRSGWQKVGKTGKELTR